MVHRGTNPKKILLNLPPGHPYLPVAQPLRYLHQGLPAHWTA